MPSEDEIAVISKVMMEKDVDGWKLAKVLGNGAFGLVFQVEKAGKKKEEKETAVMKVALNQATSRTIDWEALVMDKIIDSHMNLEDRSAHLVRKLANGKTMVQLLKEKANLSYIVMEFLPNNPVPIIGTLDGDEQTTKICEFAEQLLRGIYDLHEVGFLHRDIKPENIGMWKDEKLVLYDMGLCRNFVDSEGHHRPPRSYAGIRGTEEWCSLFAELGRDQGRVDDLWAWMYTLNEWANCKTQYPQAWSAYEGNSIRQLMKSGFFKFKSVFNNCPFVFYRIALYLRTLGRCDRPHYFYLAALIKETESNVKKIFRNKKMPTQAALAQLRFEENCCF